MATITIRNVPDDLYAELKVAAKRNRRSINNEVIHCIERTVQISPLDFEKKLALVREIRAKTSGVPISDEEIEAAINDGRP